MNVCAGKGTMNMNQATAAFILACIILPASEGSQLAGPQSAGLQRMESPPLFGANLNEPREMLKRGETFEAIRVLRRLEAARPGDGETVLLLAYAYWFAGQKQLFSRKAEAAAQLMPKSPLPHYALGRYWLDEQQRQDLAAAEFARALELDPLHPPSLYHLGWCRELNGRFEEAATLYRKSDTWLGHTGLARLALKGGKLSEALNQAQLAVKLNPDAAMAQALLGRALCELGRFTEAIRSFERAIAADPTDAKLYYQLSRCAREAGKTSVAKRYLEKFEEIQALYGSN